MEMEGDRTFVNPIGGNVSDVPISFTEPLENGLQVQSSAEDGDEKERGNVSNDPIRALHLELETLRLERSDLQRMLASSTADFEDKLSRMQQALIVKSSEAENALAEADMTKTALMERATGLMEDLNMAKEKARIALMTKEEEINTLNEELRKWKEEFEAEKEKTLYSIEKEKEMVASLEEKLLAMREKCEELAAERQKARLTMEKNEEVISSLTEELGIEREKGRNVLELEKFFTDAMAEKENEIASLKKDLLLAKEYREFENSELEEELKGLKDDVSKLEGQIKKNLSGDRDGGFLQNNCGMELKKVEDGLKISWVTAAAIMASTGTVVAVITAFCLRHKK
ncbi:hypothetical protein KSP39_PZI016963 [Platanthera zijinensis]|uniref:Uncharacterized protein n=1 Tax=Platanthera zijinensis TaxID=2320716 RepID=A0AAP0B8B6_9ASPA